MNNMMTHFKNAIHGISFDYKRLWINPFAISFFILCLLGAGMKVTFGMLVMASLLSLITHGIISYMKDGKVAYRMSKQKSAKKVNDINEPVVTEAVVEADVIERSAEEIKPSAKDNCTEKAD